MSKVSANYELNNPAENENVFLTSHSDHVIINDANNNVYAQGSPVIFNSTSLVGKDITKMLLPCEGYIVIPITNTATISSNASFLNCPQNVNLMTLKNHYSVVDRVNLSIGSVTDVANNGSYYTNLFINEKYKRKNVSDMYLDSQISPVYFDDENSYTFDATNSVGEINNNINCGISEFQKQYMNSAILSRNINRFVFSDPTNKLKYNIGSIASMEQTLDSNNAWGNSFTPYFSQTASALTWRDYIVLKLSDLNDFFKQQNQPMSNLSNLSLKLYLNLGTAQVTYTGKDNSATAFDTDDVGKVTDITKYNQYKPKSVTWNPASMPTCPYLLSSIACGNNYGEPSIKTADGNDFTITLTSTIGWSGGNGTLSSFPCRLVIPEITIHPSYLERIKSDSVRRVLYDDFLVDDTTRNIAGSGQFSKQLQTFKQRMKKLYIIPFLSNTNATVAGANTMLPPQQSCLTSAGVTCSHLKITDVQIRVGTTNLFTQELNKYNWQHYEQNQYHLLNSETGNAVNSIFKSGLITKSMWNKCYNVYEYDVNTSKFESEFDEAKQPFLTFTMLGNSNIKYDFVILIEYQREMSIDLLTGSTQ